MTERDPQARLRHALALAYRHLGRRDRTVAEVRRHLEHKRVEPGEIEAAVTHLREQGYLDDARYAQRFSEDRRVLDGWGRDRIEGKLLARGVDAELVARALAAHEAGELDAALALLRRRFPRPPADDHDRARALGLLVRRGYGLELAHDAIRALERPRAA